MNPAEIKCTSDMKIATQIIIANLNSSDIELAKKITNYVFSFNNQEYEHKFLIKCYSTGPALYDTRFCIDRGNDCEKSRVMTAFLILRKGCEIHVRDSGQNYIFPQATTDFSIIKGHDVRIIGFDKIKYHILRSYCNIIKKYKLASPLCNI